jgi:hypothetical protein
MGLATAVVLAMYIDVDTSAQTLGRPLLFVAGAVAITQAIMTLGLRSVHRGAFMTAALLMVFRTADAPHVLVGLLLLALLAGTLVWWTRIRKRSPKAASVTRFANVVTALLLLAVALTGIVNGRAAGFVQDLVPAEPSQHDVDGSTAPSILVLVLDGYPRADTVVRLLDSSNHTFLSELRARGFEVAEQSRSNYMYTMLTLSTMLHMRHIEEIDTDVGMRRVINQNPVFDFMRERGYRIMTNAVPWDGLALRSGDAFCGDAA